ncbi:MAG: OmpH family outer membrane protein [Gemmatimonadota bacterium]|nr:MAG: OmpH family outer membrane protein [Gemmatimonadota bacterium]
MARWATVATGLLVIVGIGALPAADESSPTQGPSGIAYVNSEAILQQTPGYAEADSAFTADLQAFQAEIQSLEQQLDSAATAYQQQEVVLSPAAREEKANELNAMNRQLQTRRQELQARAEERNRELMAPLQQRIQTVLDGVRAERNLAMIFDVANPTTNIVSADPTLDLTPIIIQRVQGSGDQ